MKKWTEKEIELMLKCWEKNLSLSDTSKALEKAGFSRTVTAIPLKYVHVTGKKWDERPEAKEETKKETKLDWSVIGALMVAAAIIIVWWTS
jgi:hypothetical protein